MSGQTITVPGSDGTFSGYLATPPSGNGPGIVVMQEIFGVNANIRSITDGFAAQGYFAFAPDLFWRLQPNVQLTANTDAEIQEALAYMQRFDIDKGMSDIQASITHLRTVPGATGKVGTVGYCLGGLTAYLCAARADAEANVGYYGVQIQNHLGEAAKVRRPLLEHIAEADEIMPPPLQKTITAALKPNPQITLYSYPGAGHGFARTGGHHYDKASADLANGHTAAFLKQHLG